jgi:hypothetical protein
MEWNVESEKQAPRSRLRTFAAGAALGILVALAVLMVMPLPIPYGRNARQAEGEQMGGSLKSQLRVRYAKTADGNGGHLPVPVEDYTGSYYRAVDVWGTSSREESEIYLVPLDDYHSTICVRFYWENGQSEFEYLGEER